MARYEPQYEAPDLARIRDPDTSKIQVTWVGHSTFLVQAGGVNILTDPIWSLRASPVSWAGPKRFARPGIAINDLPKIDIVLISHTHYDHLDRPTIRTLGSEHHYVIPTGMHEWFAQLDIKDTTEIQWWHRQRIGAAQVTAVPAKHWSKRNFFGTGGAGWGGYVIETSAGIIYFAGDTGYDQSYFKEIGRTFPHIDLALIPIGAYHPRAIFGRFHIDPREAVIIHKEIGAKRSIGMHWGTFKLTQEPLAEPPVLLAHEADAAGLGSDVFTSMKIGETRTLGSHGQ